MEDSSYGTRPHIGASSNVMSCARTQCLGARDAGPWMCVATGELAERWFAAREAPHATTPHPQDLNPLELSQRAVESELRRDAFFNEVRISAQDEQRALSSAATTAPLGPLPLKKSHSLDMEGDLATQPDAASPSSPLSNDAMLLDAEPGESLFDMEEDRAVDATDCPNDAEAHRSGGFSDFSPSAAGAFATKRGTPAHAHMPPTRLRTRPMCQSARKNLALTPSAKFCRHEFYRRRSLTKLVRLPCVTRPWGVGREYVVARPDGGSQQQPALVFRFV